jgi:alkylation response protein AidB-like acyl-CoA dehydrogenase
MSNDIPTDLLTRLAARADAADGSFDWPAGSWDLIRRIGATGWGVPAEAGGADLDAVAFLEGYERLAGACLTTAFILSQQDAAVRRIREHGRGEAWRELLAAAGRGEKYLTVGLSQLTTSRQHQGPSLTAEVRPDGWLTLDGVVPWVTGADRADVVIVGGVCADGRQVLAGLPPGPGVSVGEPLPLMALAGSRTAQVQCDRVQLGPEWLLAGPAPQVLASGGKRGGPGGLETSCLALGLAGAAVDHLHAEGEARPELRPVAGRFESARRRLREDLHRLAATGPAPDAALTLRVRANTLVLQATQAAVTASKGVGFVRPHPAQLWARQALFFLVWSCPRPAAEAILEQLSPCH